MILEDIITTYGTMLEIEREEYEALPCPNCHKENTAKVTLHLKYDPPGYGLKCIECGYEIPDVYRGYTYDHDAGIEKALHYWNTKSQLYKIYQEEEQNREEDRKIVDNFIMKVNKMLEEKNDSQSEKK